MDDGVDEPDCCPVCGDYEPCDHDFDVMNEQLEVIALKMGSRNPESLPK